MTGHQTTRRRILTAGASAVAGIYLPSSISAYAASTALHEVSLVDEPTRADYAKYDLDIIGQPGLKNARRDFSFPANVEVASAYGIDISHYTKYVPWKDLKAAKVSYVYMKASQGQNRRDDSFAGFWRSAATSRLPFGAYHFLTAGIPGRDQALYFLKRLAEVNGLTKGYLQPVIDLEWDQSGPAFKPVVTGKTRLGGVIYKDYWDDLSPESIIATVNDFVSTLRAGFPGLPIRPVIYTNRAWWDLHISAKTVFPNCSIWISDYRDSSYHDNSPRAVPDHHSYLWQFTDQGFIDVANTKYGPFDSNKLLAGAISHITIA